VEVVAGGAVVVEAFDVVVHGAVAVEVVEVVAGGAVVVEACLGQDCGFCASLWFRIST
jgi:hypothetical protein